MRLTFGGWRHGASQERLPTKLCAKSPRNCTSPHGQGAMYSGASEASGGANHTVWRRPSTRRSDHRYAFTWLGTKAPIFHATPSPRGHNGTSPCRPIPLWLRRAGAHHLIHCWYAGASGTEASLESTIGRELSSGGCVDSSEGARILSSSPGCNALRALPGVPHSRLRAPARTSRASPL